MVMLDLFFSYFVPVWTRLARDKQPLRKAGLILLWNLSFLLEPFFRVQLYLLIKNWLQLRIEYTEFRINALRLIQRRNRLATNLVPGHGIATLLASVGLFSAGLLLHRSSRFWWVSAQHLVFSISLFLRQRSYPFARRIRKDAVSLQMPSQTGFLYAGPDGNHNELKQAASLIVGPLELVPDNVEVFDRVYVLASKNTIDDVFARQKRHQDKLWLVCNDEFVRSLSANPDLSLSIRESFAGLYCSIVVGPLLRHSQIRWDSLNNLGLELVFPSANPHLLQRALALAIKRGETITVIGSDMLTGRHVYRKGARFAMTSNFEICLATANHNPMWNFEFTNWAFRVGRLKGNQKLRDVCDAGLEEYLDKLDLNLGSLRR